MGFFKDKKKVGENLKTLSEKDIQQRLYGHLRQDSRIVQEDLPSITKARPEVATAPKVVSVPSKDFSPAAFHAAKSSTPDLFQQPEKKSVGDPESVDSSNIRPQHFDKTRSLSPRPVSVAPPKKESSFNFEIVKKYAKLAGQFCKDTSLKVLGLLAALGLALAKTIGSLDFRKPAVRRFMYGALGMAVLAFIFVGIHHLNKNREIAMKAPRPLTPKAVITKKKNTHAGDLAVSASQIEEAQSAPENAGQQASAPTPAKKTDTKTKSSEKKTDIATPKQGANEVEKLASQPVKAAAPTVTSSSNPTAPSAVKAGPSFIIQVATFATQEDARKLEERFKTEGFRSFVRPMSRSGGRVYYCVFLGKFKTREEADQQLSKFKANAVSEPFPDSFVRSVQN